MGKQEHLILGIDVGASGIKGAVVDIRTGKLQNDRIRLETPDPPTPKAMAETFAELVRLHGWDGPIGCGFPAIIKNGVVHSAANISEKWIGEDARDRLSKASGCDVYVLNDADAAGIAEMRFGMGKQLKGSVLLITIGSGLGSALFVNGHLVPNTELGHVMMADGKPAEFYASNNARKRDALGWDEWGGRFNDYLAYIDRVINPDYVLLGGGVSKKFEKYSDYITVNMDVQPASLLNAAGTVGAAMYAYEQIRS